MSTPTRSYFKNNKGKENDLQARRILTNKRIHRLPPATVVNLDQKVKKGDVLATLRHQIKARWLSDRTCSLPSCHGQEPTTKMPSSFPRTIGEGIKFTIIHIEEFVVNVRDTKLGPEITTHDIPNVGEND